MKILFTLLFVTLLLFSCTKDITDRDSYLQMVQHALKDSLGQQDYDQLMMEGSVRFKNEKDNLSYLRIPVRGKNLATDFILLETGDNGAIKKGKIIHLEEVKSSGPKKTFNGSIAIASLDRTKKLASRIINGYIEAFHEQDALAKTGIVPGVIELPEVIVVCSYQSDYNYSYAGWLLMQSLFYDSITTNTLTTAYTYMYGGDYDGSGGSVDGDWSYNDGFTDDNVCLEEPLISVDVETQDINPAIDLQKFINCFNAIPDAGSTCSLEIFADIPVDANPNMLFNFENGSPGHTFLQLKKSNGNQSVIQNIGFYPESGLKAGLTNAPITGKFVDNGLHEYNASFKMNLSAQELKTVLEEINSLKSWVKYDIDDYNCTNFALDVFNKVRGEKMIIPLYNIPGNYPATGTKTPQGLYNKLMMMKVEGHPEAKAITIGIQKGWVSNSTGPCN